MKKFFALLLALVMTMSMVACSSDTAADVEAPEEPEETVKAHIIFGAHEECIDVSSAWGVSSSDRMMLELPNGDIIKVSAENVVVSETTCIICGR